MAPTDLQWAPAAQNAHLLSRSMSSAVLRLLSRSANTSSPPLASIFALIIRNGGGLSNRDVADVAIAVGRLPVSVSRRQQPILVIPTTYQGLNSGPSPGVVVGITLGAIAGFLLCLYIILTLVRFSGGGGGSGTVIEEEVITRHQRRKSRSKTKSAKKSRSPSRVMSEIHSPPPARSVRESLRESRRESRRTESVRRDETVIVEEELESELEPEEVVVVVEEDDEEDIVEVIEEHSADPSIPPSEPRQSTGGFRIVDPSQPGGGAAPRRKIRRRP